MEYIQFFFYAALCAGCLTTILLWKHDSQKKQKTHEDELFEMEMSTQERIEQVETAYEVLQDEYLNLESELDIERSRNRKVRPGFNVLAVTKAVNKAKGERVS